MRFYVLVALLLASGTVSAEQHGKKSWPVTSGTYHSIAQYENAEYFRVLMKNRYADLLQALENREHTARITHALKEQQEAWGEYIQKECALFGQVRGGGDPWRRYASNMCMGIKLEARYKRMRDAKNCVVRGESEYVTNECLWQLLPLSWKGQ